MRKNNSLLLFICIAVLFSCHKTNVAVIDPAIQTNVYVAGYEGTVAKYWKNGTAVSLSNATTSAAYTSITVSGNDVYIAGDDYNVAGIAVAEYWKNGIKVILSDGTKNAAATSIAVSGNDVYVAGVVSDDNQSEALYWKNGQPIALDNTAYGFAYAYAISVSGNDVYVAGQDAYFNAVYWKNGTKVILGDNGSDNPSATALAIAVSGNDVYVAGTTSLEPPGPGNTGQKATVWKNGTATYLLDSSNNTNATYGYGIAVTGNTVYVAGRNGYQSNKDNAMYWKNDTAYRLTPKITDYELANSVAVSDGDVYVAGAGYNGSGSHIARYWKNGIAVDLTDGSVEAVANSIFIAKQ